MVRYPPENFSTPFTNWHLHKNFSHPTHLAYGMNTVTYLKGGSQPSPTPNRGRKRKIS